jgi:molecular chaperone GrpE
MTKTELLTMARGVMKRWAEDRRTLGLRLRGWRDLSVQSVEAFGDVLELLDAFVNSESVGSDGEAVNYIRSVAELGWQRLAATGAAVDGMVGEEFDPDRHHAVQEIETDTSPRRWVARTIEHGLVVRGERIRRAKVVISGRRPA